MTAPYTHPAGAKVITIPEVAAYLKMSRSKIYYLVSQKHIPYLKVGRNVRIRESDLQNWLDCIVHYDHSLFMRWKETKLSTMRYIALGFDRLI
jgi:excisionase family DNA binding protein